MKFRTKLITLVAGFWAASNVSATAISNDIDFSLLTLNGYERQNNANSAYDTYSESTSSVLSLSNDSWFSLNLADTFGISSINIDDASDYVFSFDFSLVQTTTNGTSAYTPEISGLYFADFSSGTPNAISSQSFNLAGTQDWGLDDFIYTSDTWQTFSITLDDYISGKFTDIIFINDCDGYCGDVEVLFKNVTLSEVNAPTAISLALLGLGVMGWRRHRQSKG
jgi:hypothetical protein